MSSCLFVTANIGSICEAPKELLPQWVNEFCMAVSRIKPNFIALHCQEVGGKDFETNMKHVDELVRLLLSSEPLRRFDTVRVYLDEDYTSPEKFTALGNFYFVQSSFVCCKLWNFESRVFESVADKEVFIGTIEAVPSKEKRKFPKDFFPQCKWSRKGFMRTRWCINGTIVDLINVHLFHDASNLVSIEKQPSEYCIYRRRALAYSLNRFYEDDLPNVPFFIFGDFNFRPNSRGVVEKLSLGLTRNLTQDSNDPVLEYCDGNNKSLLSISKKLFQHHLHENIFSKECTTWLKKYDFEIVEFEDRLFEYPINFPPSYPFSENILEPNSYMCTRCPSWCDRVLLSYSARDLCLKKSGDCDVIYDTIGKNTCMGDHKPVFLNFRLREHLDNMPVNKKRIDSEENLSGLNRKYSDPATVTRYYHYRSPNSYIRRETTL